jgi:cellulose synthase/poly-beta-1,6-N-acetylglucosamine synthase-like glycosyltransferase
MFIHFAQALVFLTGCYYFGVFFYCRIKRARDKPPYYQPCKSFALIIPAHNEEMVIGQVIDSLKKQNYPKQLYDIFVVADNCTDTTAAIAHHHGATVFERYDSEKKGKGHALEWIFAKLYTMEDRYDAISVFDADNLVSPNYLSEMNNQLCSGHKVVQGYIDSKNPFDSWITCSYTIAFWLSNFLFQLPRSFLGLCCGLCGTGFCIDMSVLKEIGWGATCLTEDLEFTMKLALNDMKVAWAHNAVVYDEKPLTLPQSWRQRKRWMQGHADCAARFFIPLIKKAVKSKDLIALDCALYLLQPIKYVFVGLVSVLLWLQILQTSAPPAAIQNFFPAHIWNFFTVLQMFFGPLVIFSEQKFNWRTLWGFIVFPLYCLTWVPITIQGFLSKGNKIWAHTPHTRVITIEEIEKAQP